MARSIAVVGGGMAGLAAAWRLVEGGASVTLYERHERAGGRLRTDELDGSRGDVVVQLLASHYTETLRLVRAAGAADLLVRSGGRDALWRNGRAHPIAYGSAASMARSSALPLGLKARLATRYLPFLQRHARELDGNDPVRAVAAGHSESIAEWGRRELGDEFVELLVYPLLASYYGLTPEEAPSGLYHSLAHVGLDVRVYAVTGGMALLAAAIARRLEAAGARLLRGSAIEGLEVLDRGVLVRWSGGEREHDAVVLAVPPPVAAALAGVPPPLDQWLSAVRTRPVTTVGLAVKRPPPAEWFGLSFPRHEPPGRALAAVCLQGRKAARLVAPGRGFLVAYPAPALAERVAASPAGAVVDGVVAALERVFPGLGDDLTRARVYRVPGGSVVFDLAHVRHLAHLDPAWLGPRLALAGDWLRVPTVEGAVRSGLAAAERLLKAG